MDQQIETMGKKAEIVAELTEAQNAAFEELAGIEAELLDTVVARVRPALKGLASRIMSDYREWWPDNSCSNEEFGYLHERGLITERGLCVCGKREAELDYPGARNGEYEGKSLFLLTDGRWLELRYEGTWSAYQGSSSAWTATAEPMTSAEVIARGYPVDDIVKAISEALDRQLSSGRQKATKKALEQAKKLRALISLL